MYCEGVFFFCVAVLSLSASLTAVCVCVTQVEKVLSLHELSSSTLHHTQGCSAMDGQGLQPGLEKLYEMILKRKKMLRHSKKKR